MPVRLALLCESGCMKIFFGAEGAAEGIDYAGLLTLNAKCHAGIPQIHLCIFLKTGSR